MMMNHTMQLNHAAPLTVSSVSGLSSFAFNAASFYSALRFYFYYFFIKALPSKRKFVS